MLHISSEDLKKDSGKPYQGTLNFARSIAGTWKVVHSAFEAGDIPWVFANSDTLKINDTTTPGVKINVTFPELILADETAQIKATLDAALTPITTVIAIQANGDYLITFSTAVDVRWSLSNLNNIFHGEKIDEINVLSILWEFPAVNNNPDLLELHFDTAIKKVLSPLQQRAADLIVSRSLQSQTVVVLEEKFSTTVDLQRLTGSGVIPSLLRWDILFEEITPIL